jgi:hypothetical protein
VELWELVARESIRDLVARYNANGDAGRFEQMLAVFADDAVLELVSSEGEVRRYEGAEAIATVFTATRSEWDRASRGRTGRHHVRHFTATLQIDVDGPARARGRSYFMVVMPHGLDHWGRYVDEYGVREGRWVITSRRALSDGRIEGGFTG